MSASVSASAVRVVAHAKINLFLRVLAREQSGFHSIETIFARLALGDLVTVRVRASGRAVECVGVETGPPERNLAYRAAVAFADATGWPSGFAIEIQKRVPVGGGLGGGSADAGAVLRALAALSPRPLPEAELLRIAAPLGSDVPFLTSNAPLALAWGRGERMLALPALPEREVVLVNPGFAVSTADAYAWLAAERERDAALPAPSATLASSEPLASRVLSLHDLAGWDSIALLAENDFERPVAGRHPEIARSIAELRRSGASIARMSGSGSTVYGIFGPTSPSSTLAHTIQGTTLLTSTLATIQPVEALP